MEKKESSYTVGRNVNCCSHYGEQDGVSLKKLKIELPYNPAISLLGVYKNSHKNSNLKRLPRLPGSKQLLCVGPQMTHGMSWGGSLYGEELIGDVSVEFCPGTTDGGRGGLE